MRAAPWLAVLWLTACAPPDQELLDVPPLDEEAYARQVHPVLEPSCATLDCHGMDDRPLRLYAETGLRLRDELRDAPITAEELRANTRALAALDPDPPSIEASLVLLEPLAEAEGGVHHLGGDLWDSPEDPSYLCVEAFLAGRSAAPEARRACAEAWDEVGLPPP